MESRIVPFLFCLSAIFLSCEAQLHPHHHKSSSHQLVVLFNNTSVDESIILYISDHMKNSKECVKLHAYLMYWTEFKFKDPEDITMYYLKEDMNRLIKELFLQLEEKIQKSPFFIIDCNKLLMEWKTLVERSFEADIAVDIPKFADTLLESGLGFIKRDDLVKWYKNLLVKKRTEKLKLAKSEKEKKRKQPASVSKNDKIASTKHKNILRRDKSPGTGSLFFLIVYIIIGLFLFAVFSSICWVLVVTYFDSTYPENLFPAEEQKMSLLT